MSVSHAALRRKDISGRIFLFLSSQDIYAYGRVCRRFRRLAQCYHQRCFTEQHLYGRFFQKNEFKPLRNLQLLTGMLISGSTVLQFLERVTYPHSDMDMFVDRNHSLTVIRWLEDCGFVVIKPQNRDPVASLTESLKRWNKTLASKRFPHAFCIKPPSSAFHSTRRRQFPKDLPPSNPYSGTAGICQVVSLQRAGKIVQVIAMEYNPLEAILTFHSTTVMNIATHDKVYALYPSATFLYRQCVRVASGSTPKAATIAKWEKRGWNVVRKPSIALDTMIHLSQVRHVGDGLCWNVTLPSPIDETATIFPIEHNTWACSRLSDPEIDSERYAMDFTTTFRTSTKSSFLQFVPSSW